ncbi:RNA polymerase sigma-70 factor [Pedobacter insulae]|uniref:RNA polymerase sigma-70 factor, ECF subfamily n=1 Tax=Pedobacter insulae TaxID=414048 RepID=A0A1I2TES2_9SPHI|nr:RNA polymerase sigma-70 factor [Pedobacter insulae]SFG63412.1 RNA polymerase sigma-70 factor, ECF subfamily [Pedobacter insulae]
MEIATGKDLFNIVNKGQTLAFTQFYTSFFQKLLLASHKYVKDAFIAEEIVQNVFLKMWESPEDLEHVMSIKAYMYKSVINASINHLNRQKNIEHHHQKIAANFTDGYLVDTDDENELIVLLHREIDKLPPQCKRIFKLNRFDCLKYREIAEMLQISERTVENHIALALKTLRKSFTEGKSTTGRFIISLFLY